ncbi:hypothetical protein U91I_01829 [alpha proteobacterium U9-1i]|nr:hypothetical protein U91I_01829 [alpha proteobacterium U9-1i]
MAAIGNMRVLAMIAFAATALIALDLFNMALDKIYAWPGPRVWAPVLGALVAAGFLVRVRYAAFTPLLAMSLRATAAGLLAVMVFARPDFTVANPDFGGTAADYINHAYFLLLPVAVLALFRPAFVIPVAIYLYSSRELVQYISGLIMSDLDIRYMLDMALFLALGGLAITQLGPRIHPWLAAPERQGEIVGAAFGLHLANYFWSGIAKLAIGPTPWYWITQNHTYNQIPHTIESGILPLGHLPWLAEFAYEAMRWTFVPLNAAIVVAQLFAIICIFRIDWLKICSVLFDLLHLGIYFFGGLFFWPWIWNNLTIWWAARSSKAPLMLNTKVACIVAILLGAPIFKVNEAAWLAWYDVSDARQSYFAAVTEDGREIKVPSAFFLSHSYSVSHGNMALEYEPGHYEHTTLASARFLDRNEASGQCADPATFPRRGYAETPAQHTERMEWLQRFLSTHHAKMEGREATFGRGNFYFRSHHHPSNPFLYSEFNALPLSDVVGYRLITESACYGLDAGRVTKRVLARNVEYFSVR